MKTKTPAQIFKQWERLAKNADTPRNIVRVKQAATFARKYWNNIYQANGVDRINNKDTDEINNIWEHAAAPLNVYARNN